VSGQATCRDCDYLDECAHLRIAQSIADAYLELYFLDEREKWEREKLRRSMRRYQERRKRKHTRHILSITIWHGQQPPDEVVARWAHGHRYRLNRCRSRHCAWCSQRRTYQGRRSAEAARAEVEAFT
jgi:hypothetical protein